MNERISSSGQKATGDQEFSPVGTMTLMILYIIVFAAAWGSVYFLEFLARR